MTEEIGQAVKAAVKDLSGDDLEVELTRPEEQFGDYASNVAMKLSAKMNRTPREIAEELAARLKETALIKDVQVAGPGFINIVLHDEQLAAAAEKATSLPKPLEGQKILVEFGDPNPFKEMHIGHLYSYIVGDAIAKLLEANGANVRRLSYHGDVGLHVAKAVWGMLKSGVDVDKVDDSIKQNIGLYYVEGAKAYEQSETAKQEIDDVNEHVYKRDDEHINKLYDWGKEKSFAYFRNVLEDFAIKNDEQFLESDSAAAGLRFVREHLGSVFKESNGAIIFDGERIGLHTRVFITSKGLPTYEAKDLGLAELKNQRHPDAVRSIIITAHEQADYFRVMLAALAEFDKPLADKTTHLSHGFVSLSSGKMSSRTGDVYSVVSVLVDMEEQIKKIYPKAGKDTEIAAVKYGLLKHRLGSDIVYDMAESFSIEGNSGPYLQYAHARARNILQKSVRRPGQITDFQADERSLARKISEYPEVVAKAAKELMPHHVANYLYELSQSFNRFYEHNRVIGDPREDIRLKLVAVYADILKDGLELLNIPAPQHV